ncbi:thiaminase/transcriptional activator TenA [Bacillus pakistanensis]|uniref:Aminopyrimidine aminohydrolase n=1 Tax=Rossellomorea pakistanensis TaxID=992288 RepID=A0ABS2ND16_9BACI|nr:thiaminase II [Bacillus pakistanensis]MBM7585735.1 thiaminase/transcriptional activator TenA [Bacillus pakistanensis]
MSFSQYLRKEADAIWEASFNHPFVKGIGDGTLSLENFRYYVLQDAYYLTHFSRVQALGAAKATDLATTASMAAHAQGTNEAELSLHENFSKRLGITDEERQNFKPAPTAYAYTSHMYRAAQFGHLGDIIAAILPCYWLYYEIGERLQECSPEESIYKDWIAAYGGEWFRELVEEQIQRLDDIAETVTESDRQRMKELFITSSIYELQFWEMAHTLEEWPFGNEVFQTVTAEVGEKA